MYFKILPITGRSCWMDGHRTDGQTEGWTDAKLNLYSVQCCTLHWTDNY